MPSRMSHQGGLFAWALALPALIFGLGCGQRVTSFEVINFPAGGDTERFHEIFDECYYAVAPDGNLDVVARRHTRGIPNGGERGAEVTQIVYLRTVFRVVPGTTHAESTMINGIIGYAIISGDGGSSFEGAGCFSCTENRPKTVLTGSVELARLSPYRRVGVAPNLFDRAELNGKFTAQRNRRKVVAILNEINRFFGPEPLYVPDAGPDLL